MNSYIQTLRSDWHLMRIIYMILAVAMLAQAWQARDWTFGLLGALFLYQGIFNTGCCGAGRSPDPADRGDSPKTLQDTDYTEIN